jgi:hypothetical protein
MHHYDGRVPQRMRAFRLEHITDQIGLAIGTHESNAIRQWTERWRRRGSYQQDDQGVDRN